MCEHTSNALIRAHATTKYTLPIDGSRQYLRFFPPNFSWVWKNVRKQVAKLEPTPNLCAQLFIIF